MAEASSRSLVISYLTLRKSVGILGIALPFVLVIGQWLIDSSALPSSMSSYYYTGLRDVFVGFLCAIAVFLMSYKGYSRIDDLAGDAAAIFGVGVALVPTVPDGKVTANQQLVGYFHIGFAALFFLTLAYFSIVLFTKTGDREPTPRKLQRNLVYRICGYVMLVCLAGIAFVGLVPGVSTGFLEPFNLVFWLEAVAIVAFGVSWLVKGEAILQDQ